MVRLVFRPYTQVWRTICTSVPLRASIRVSPDFTLLKHSSPSFGSDPYCSYSNLTQERKVGRLCKTKKSNLLLSFRVQVCHPHTRNRSRLLGPCFKTGRKKPFSHRRGREVITPHQGCEQHTLEVYQTVTLVTTHWKLNAFLYRAKSLDPRMSSAAAKTQS